MMNPAFAFSALFAAPAADGVTTLAEVWKLIWDEVSSWIAALAAKFPEGTPVKAVLLFAVILIALLIIIGIIRGGRRKRNARRGNGN